MAKTSEHDIAVGVMIVAATCENGLATFEKIYEDLPDQVDLTDDDWEPSITRNGEPMWRQIVRNIKSHSESEGNAIYKDWLQHVPKKGYKITPRGRRYLGLVS